MRKIDETKREQIIKSVFKITYEDGIANLSIGKIGKAVGVSKATIYIYFDNKTDMLGKIYLDVKDLMDDGLVKLLDKNISYRDRVGNVLKHFAQKFIDHPLEANFMRSIQNNPTLVDKEVIEESEKMAEPLYNLVCEGINNHYLITDDTEILVSLLFAPIVNYIEFYIRKEQLVPKEKLEELIKILVDECVVE